MQHMAHAVTVLLHQNQATQEQLREVRQELSNLRHSSEWQLYALQTQVINMINEERVAFSRVAPRTINYDRVYEFEALEPICLPTTIHPPLVVPDPPHFGEPPIHPPPPPSMEDVPGPHPLFPATRGGFDGLTETELQTLLTAYGLTPPQTVFEQREMFGKFIGVRIKVHLSFHTIMPHRRRHRHCFCIVSLHSRIST
ncbi:hypothetical protein DL93DRAFT_1051048 [Clavulina sp. PMI_390]|nr:hypothetical protein DL93DRAFT_1051048 [Clavulina sp. PMI_390]